MHTFCYPPTAPGLYILGHIPPSLSPGEKSTKSQRKKKCERKGKKGKIKTRGNTFIESRKNKGRNVCEE
jgi:hypothetical protein